LARCLWCVGVLLGVRVCVRAAALLGLFMSCWFGLVGFSLWEVVQAGGCDVFFCSGYGVCVFGGLVECGVSEVGIVARCCCVVNCALIRVHRGRVCRRWIGVGDWS